MDENYHEGFCLKSTKCQTQILTLAVDAFLNFKGREQVLSFHNSSCFCSTRQYQSSGPIRNDMLFVTIMPELSKAKESGEGYDQSYS